MGRPRIEWRRSLVPVEKVDALSAVDSLVIKLPARMERNAFDALRAAVDPDAFIPNKHWIGNELWCYLITLHRPTYRAMELLAAVRSPWSFCQVDVALDLVTGTRDDAYELRDHVVGRLVKRQTTELLVWKGKDGDRRARTAYYSWSLGKGSQLVVYADRPTKLDGNRPCVHIEYRIRGAMALRQQGLSSLHQVASLDHLDFWDQRLKLVRAPEREDLRRLIGGTGQPALRRFDRALEGIDPGPLATVPSNDLWCLLKQVGMRPAGWFRREPHQWMLPTSRYDARWAGDSRWF